MKIEVLSDVDALEQEWDALLDATCCNRAFSSYAWFRAATAEGGTPLIVTARNADRLVAILPLFVPDGAREATFATRLADYNDVIAIEDVTDALIDAALDVVPALRLRGLRAESPLCKGELEPDRAAVWTSIAGGYDAWLAGRSRAFRKSLFRAQRAAAAAGLVVRELEDAASFLALHDARARISVFDDEPNRSFIGRALPPLLAQKRMRAFGVLAQENVVAIDLCAAGADSLCTWNTGFLPEYAGYSPGTLLLAEEIRVACGEGLREFDLLRGEDGYKASWAGERRRLFIRRR